MRKTYKLKGKSDQVREIIITAFNEDYGVWKKYPEMLNKILTQINPILERDGIEPLTDSGLRSAIEHQFTDLVKVDKTTTPLQARLIYPNEVGDPKPRVETELPRVPESIREKLTTPSLRVVDISFYTNTLTDDNRGFFIGFDSNNCYRVVVKDGRLELNRKPPKVDEKGFAPVDINDGKPIYSDLTNREMELVMKLSQEFVKLGVLVR